MSIPKLKFFALFFVFFAVFWQITTSFYIKMLSAGRQDFSRAAKGAAGLPRKESLRLFQPQADGAVFCGALFLNGVKIAVHPKKTCAEVRLRRRGAFFPSEIYAKNFTKACGRVLLGGAQTCAAKWRAVRALPCYGATATKWKQKQFYRLLGKNAVSPVPAWARKLASPPVFAALRRFAAAAARKTEWRSGTTRQPRVGKTVCLAPLALTES